MRHFELKRKLRAQGKWIVIASVLGLTCFYAGSQWQIPPIQSELSLERSAMAAAKPSTPEAALLRKSSESFRAVAKQVGPAVVTIKSLVGPKVRRPPGIRGRGRQQPEEESPFPNDPFSDFFRRFGQPSPFPGPQQETPQTGLGSGFIIDKRGYIVTNNHVVDGATKITVTLPGDEKNDLTATVVGTDAKTDLAVIKIKTSRDLPVAEWADSDAVEVGDWALAIGSPFMLTHSVTLGIVSAKGRNSSNLMGADYGYEMLQTDAAINPGNSGGPLCTIDAKVMGVNAAIFTRSGGYMGIGFAIPSNLAKEITATLIQGGKVVRGWLGVSIQPVEDSMAKELGIKNGAIIHQVQPNSPAEKAGLKSGDVIIEVAGKSTSDPTEVQRLVSSKKPGESIPLKVVNYNDKKTRTVSVKIGELSAENVEEPASEGPATGEPDKLGIVVARAKGGDGIRVEQVDPNSVGAMAGLKPGDAIVSINREPIRSVEAYKKKVKSSKHLNMIVKRNGQEVFFQIQMPD